MGFIPKWVQEKEECLSFSLRQVLMLSPAIAPWPLSITPALLTLLVSLQRESGRTPLPHQSGSPKH